jgi:hypothetical protein
MKKINILLVILFIGVTFFTSCEKNADDHSYSGDPVIAFEKKNGSISEADEEKTLAISVFMNKTSEVTGEVAFDFDTAGIKNPAIEGVDFELVNSSKILAFAADQYFANIEISPIDNDLFEGNKEVNVVLTTGSAGAIVGYDNGESAVSYKVTLIDNEHPLAVWIGSYTGTFAGHGPITTEAYTETQLRVHGLASYVQTGWGESWVEGDGSCIMDFNTDGTVTIEPQWIGDSDFPDVYGMIGEGTYESDGTITITYELFYGWDGVGGVSVFGGAVETVLTKD